MNGFIQCRFWVFVVRSIEVRDNVGVSLLNKYEKKESKDVSFWLKPFAPLFSHIVASQLRFWGVCYLFLPRELLSLSFFSIFLSSSSFVMLASSAFQSSWHPSFLRTGPFLPYPLSLHAPPPLYPFFSGPPPPIIHLPHFYSSPLTVPVCVSRTNTSIKSAVIADMNICLHKGGLLKLCVTTW